MRHLSSPLTIAILTLASFAMPKALAGDCCCERCGCQSCQKVCRLVCEEKKVDIICWGCKCEDFCLPKAGCRGCKHCETVCADCDACAKCDEPHAEPKRFVWWDWSPTCAKMFTKKKLMQKIETKKVPTYKWVVEDLCSSCEATCDCADIIPGADVPPPPVADARLLYGSRR